MAEPSYDIIKLAAMFYFIENLPCLILFLTGSIFKAETT